MRLTSVDQMQPPLRPGYRPADHRAGIVHLGIGAFHRAHQADATDRALAAAGGDWRITGVSLRGTEVAAALNPQHGLYTLIERGSAGSSARVIGAVAQVIAGPNTGARALDAMVDPVCRIVSLTVTEKAYGLDRATQGCDPAHPAVAADLAQPQAPRGVLGLLTRALALRRSRGVPPFTVLCCDNLPENGVLLRGAVLDFARRIDPDLASWIAGEVAFPSSMVDRITPAPTPQTLAEAERLVGVADWAAVATEPFSQWVIEDHFPLGRPAWEISPGVIFASDVAPYERMKLRMLNGTHSMLAYAGFLTGKTYVRDVMADPALSTLVVRHLNAAAATLPPLSGVNFTEYGVALRERFANPSIAHETYQIAMDGTEKLPQRIFLAALDAVTAGQDLRSFAFATAAWARYTLGHKDDGTFYALRDPREDAIRVRIAGSADAQSILEGLFGLPGFIPKDLSCHAEWRETVQSCLSTMLADGMAAAVNAEAVRG